MTKKFLVPLLVAPLILSGCGNNKKALKPFEKGDNVLTAELVKALVGEPEESKVTISEETTATPEGYELMGTSLGMLQYSNAEGKAIVLSAYNGKEIFNFDTTKIDSFVATPFTEFLVVKGNPTAGYATLSWTEGEAPNEVYKSKAVDSFGNVLYDWSGTDVAEVPAIADFVFEGSSSDFSCLKFTQWKDHHNNISYKVYAEDYGSLEDVEYLPGSGESIAYIDMEFEKDGKNYRVDMDTEKLQFDIYQVTDKGDKLVKTMTLPDRSTWAVDSYSGARLIVYSEYSYVIVTDRVVPADATEWTYLAPAAVSYSAEFSGEGDTEGEFSGEVTGSYVVPGLTEKHLQEVHVYDLYEMEETSVASAYVIESLDDSGLADLELDEDLLADPYLFVAELTEVDENGFPTEISHNYLVDDNFGLHDELFLPQLFAIYGLLMPFGDNYVDGIYKNAIYDANLKTIKSLPDAFTVEDLVGDYAIVSTEDFEGNTAYALMDSDAKLVTNFEFSNVYPLDDTHFLVFDLKGEGNGVLDMSKGSVKWFDDPYAKDALFSYYQVGEGDNVKYEAYYYGIYFKDAVVSEGEPVFFADPANLVTVVNDPLGHYVKTGFRTLREGTTDVYDIHWFKVSM